MTDYDVVVIGAGNAGLTAALTLARQGSRVMLLERHMVPGGSATSFHRGRFEFEVALHQLSGLGTPDHPGPLRDMLGKLGVLDDLTWVEMTDLYTVRMPDGFHLVLKPDQAQNIEILATAFPHEKQAIHRFFELMAAYAGDMLGAFIFRDPEASREKYPRLYKYALRPILEVLDEFFTDPKLKMVLSLYWGYLGVPPSRLAFAYLALVYFVYVEFKPFHLKGGSQAMSNAMLARFLAAGGRVRFNTEVGRIKVHGGRIQSVVTDSGDEYTTRFVVSNASPVATYTRMIGPENLPEEARVEMRGRRLSASAFTLYVGFDREPADLGFTESTNFLVDSLDLSDRLAEKMNRLDITDETMVLSCYDVSDPEFSPPGTCQANIVTLKYGQPWLQLPPHRYYQVKARVAASMLDRVEAVFPGIREHIEEIEVGTPLTHMRYLGHPAGAIYGYEQQTKDSLFFQPGRRSAIPNLLFAGGYTGDCGFQPTMESGVAAAKAIIRQLG